MTNRINLFNNVGDDTQQVVILTEGYSTPFAAKTAISFIRYRTDAVVGVIDKTEQGQTCQSLFGVGGDIPVVGSLAECPGANMLLIGIAPPGGALPAEWMPIIFEAIERKMTIVSGLHDFLSDDASIMEAASKQGATIIDVRKNDEHQIAMRDNINHDCLKIHTVGHDCSIGKMVVSIELTRGLLEAGHDAKFIATGQTGIMISGEGAPIDCVKADFISGTAEKLILENQHHEILVVEGQGSISHPSYSGVTMGLLHGIAPDGLILCYEVDRTEVKGLNNIPLQSLIHLKRMYEEIASMVHPAKVIGIGMNSRTLSDAEANIERDRVSQELGLPACDIFRHGTADLVKAVQNLKRELGK